MKNFPKKAAAASEILIVISAAITFSDDIYRNNIMESFYCSGDLFFVLDYFIYAACLIASAANLLVYKWKIKRAPIVMSAAAVVFAYVFNADVRHSEITVMDAYNLQKYFDWQYSFDAETANTVFFLICAAALITVCGAVYAFTENKDTASRDIAAASAKKIMSVEKVR